jgi:HTH-type transcriptional regulator / antitoxin HigA
MYIRPIRTDGDHAEALAEIERLWGADPGSAEGDKLDVLATLVERYEEDRWPISPSDPVEMLEFALSDMGRSQAELGRLIGRSRASEVLSRKRPLTLPMMRILHETWHLPAEVLIQPYRLDARAHDRERGGASAKRHGQNRKVPEHSGRS